MSSGPKDERVTPTGAQSGAPSGDAASERGPSTNPFERDDEKRGAERAAVQLRVDYKRINTFFADYTKNISKGGTFIRTAKPLEIGTEFVFVLSVPSHNTQLALKGEVVRVVTEEEATADNPAGMGIRFKFDSDAERDMVDDFVEKLMDEALGKHISTKLLKKT